MNKQNIIKNSLIGAVIIVLILLAYKFLVPTKKDKNVEPKSSTQGIVANTQATSVNPNSVSIGDIDLLRNKLSSIKVDTGIFLEKDFSSLEDYRKTIQKEPVGRIDPFAKI